MTDPNLITDMSSNTWMLEPRSLKRLMSLQAKSETAKNEKSESFTGGSVNRPAMNVVGNTAVISISGILTKSAPWWYELFDVAATEYGDIQTDLNTALGDDNVERILLHVSSPGGSVAGVDELATAICDARNQKPIDAMCDDLAASAAYYLASQSHRVYANITGEVGSIGVYCVLDDYSKMFTEVGIKVNVIKSGPDKGVGVLGTAITDDQLKPFQEIVDGLCDQFVAAVSRGRGVSESTVRAWATGRTWLAGEAEKLGLIDGISNMADVLSDVRSGADNNSKVSEEKTMSNEVDEKAIADKAKAEARAEETARLGQLKAAFPGNPEFAMEQFEAGSTVEQAKAAYCDVLIEKSKADAEANAEAIAAKDAEIETLKKAKAPEASGESTEGVNYNGEGGEGGETGFMAQAQAMAEKEKISVNAAASHLARQDPDAYKAYKAGLRVNKEK